MINHIATQGSTHGRNWRYDTVFPWLCHVQTEAIHLPTGEQSSQLARNRRTVIDPMTEVECNRPIVAVANISELP